MKVEERKGSKREGGREKERKGKGRTGLGFRV